MSDDRYDRVVFHGRTMNKWTQQALEACEKALGYELTITQGSYNAGKVSASAGTHDGGGVVDLAHADWQNKVRVLRENGFAAWHRLPSQGPWPEHIHCVLIGDIDAAPSAQRQVESYRAGRNGLANNARDDGPRVLIKEFTYRSIPGRKSGMNNVEYGRYLIGAGLAELKKAPKKRTAVSAMVATVVWALKIGPKS